MSKMAEHILVGMAILAVVWAIPLIDVWLEVAR